MRGASSTKTASGSAPAKARLPLSRHSLSRSGAPIVGHPAGHSDASVPTCMAHALADGDDRESRVSAQRSGDGCPACLFLSMPSFTSFVAGFMWESRRAARMCIATAPHRCQRVTRLPTAPPERRSRRKSRTLYIALTLHAPRSLSGPGPARVVPAPSFSSFDHHLTIPLQSLAKDSATLCMLLHRHTLGPVARLEHGPVGRRAAAEAW